MGKHQVFLIEIRIKIKKFRRDRLYYSLATEWSKTHENEFVSFSIDAASKHITKLPNFKSLRTKKYSDNDMIFMDFYASVIHRRRKKNC